MTNALLTTSLPGVVKAKIQQNSKISFCEMMKYKLFHMKVLLKCFINMVTPQEIDHTLES